LELVIQKFAPMRLAYMRNLGPYETCHFTWEKFGKWLGQKRLFGPKSMIMGLSWDDPQTTPPEKIRYDCCITVDDRFQADEQVQIQDFAGGEYAIYTLKGSYSKMPQTFAKMYREGLAKLGRKPACGPCIEIYRTNPDRTPPEENITDLCIPIQPAG